MSLLLYPAEGLLHPRSFIFSCNTEVLTVQSYLNETRITFLNSLAGSNSVEPRYALTMFNDDFRIQRGSNTDIAVFNVDPYGVPQVQVPGSILANRTKITEPAKKSIVLSDTNPYSQHQYAGVGYTDGRIYYQLPGSTTFHGFYAAANSLTSTELMRIAQSTTGLPQVGIGTDVLSSNALSVSGNANIHGSLTVTGNISFDEGASRIVRTDPGTHRLTSGQLPVNVVYMSPTTNQIDPSFLPHDYNFQFLRANKNVGIGTRIPLQKLHVVGDSTFSTRVGIGITYPSSRLHVVESNAAAPTAILQNNAGGDVLRTTYNGNPVLTVTGTGSNYIGVGIGTSIVSPTRVLEVHGNSFFNGTVTASNLISPVINIGDGTSTFLRTETVTFSDGTVGPAFRSYLPFYYNGGVSATSISSIGATQYVEFKDCGAQLDGDLVLGGQIFMYSDERLKTNLKPLKDPLKKIDRIRGYSYNFHPPKGSSQPREQVGLLAQELLSVLPEAVSMHNDNYIVSYDSLVPLLVEAIRELSNKVRSLERTQKR